MQKITTLICTIFFLTCYPASANNIPQEKRLKQGEFRLSYTPSPTIKYKTSGISEEITIPALWIKPETNSELTKYLPELVFNPVITSFNISSEYIGLHLSSYEIQPRGSAQTAAGQDIFLVYSRKKNKVYKGLIDLGITKGRQRNNSCFSAFNTRFILSDINNDSHLDIGIHKEQLSCKEKVHDDSEYIVGPFYESKPTKWYLFKNTQWIYSPDYDRRFPKNHYWVLPLIDISKSPLNYVMELNKKD